MTSPIKTVPPIKSSPPLFIDITLTSPYNHLMIKKSKTRMSVTISKVMKADLDAKAEELSLPANTVVILALKEFLCHTKKSEQKQ